jgi:hypothetical protein
VGGNIATSFFGIVAGVSYLYIVNNQSSHWPWRLVSNNLKWVRSRPIATCPFLFNMRKKLKFPVRYLEAPKSEMCIYKAWAEGKYLLWKGLSLTQSVGLLTEGINRAFSSPPKEESPIYGLCNHIISQKAQWIEVEPIIYPSDALDLLKKEYNLLQEVRNDPNCLNTIFDPYMPQWLPVTAVNNYKEWVSMLKVNANG